MGRKRRFQDISSAEKKNRMKSSSPLRKIDDAIDINDIINSDEQLVKVHFIADMSVMHKKSAEIQLAYKERFGEEITVSGISRLKRLMRMVYLTEISTSRDEMVAEELMHADWELRELQEYWEKSKQPKTKKVHHTADSDGTEMTTYNLEEDTETEERQIGDLEAMKRIAGVRERVIRLLGLEAPKQQPENKNEGIKQITVNIVGATRTVQTEEAQIVE